MSRIVVVGAGFAGVWSALAAARVIRDHHAHDRLEVTVVAPDDQLVLRPRLYQASPDRHQVPLRELFEPAGVKHVTGWVERIDHLAKTVEIVDGAGARRRLGWDRLVLASGSQITPPRVAGAGRIHDVDSLAGARALEAHLLDLSHDDAPDRWTAVVVGSGFTGLEVATELLVRLRHLAAAEPSGRAPRVVLVEQAHELAPSLGPGPRAAIMRQLSDAGVEVHLGEGLSRYDEQTATFASGTQVRAGTVVWTVGMTASTLTSQLPGRRDSLGRLEVDDHLRLPGADGVFVAGDTAAARADETHVVTQSCQFAIPLGKTAGWNAASELLGLADDLLPFRPGPYVTCLDLGEGGAVFTTGWERMVRYVGEEAKQLKGAINEMIRPVVEDPEALMQQASPSWVPDGPAGDGPTTGDQRPNKVVHTEGSTHDRVPS